MADNFNIHASGISAPASRGFNITPHATNEVEETTRAVWVGGGGDLAVEMRDGGTVTFTGVAAGSLLPFRVRKVLVAGTTATAIIGLV